MASEPPKTPLPKRLIGLDLKMYLDLPQTKTYIQNLTSNNPPPQLTVSNTSGLFILPSTPLLQETANILHQMKPTGSPASLPILFGAQNCHWSDSGPFSGEVSPLILKQLGCTIVKVNNNSTDDATEEKGGSNSSSTKNGSEDNLPIPLLITKCQAVIRNGMIPLICIGERLPRNKKSGIISEAVGLAVRECVPQVEKVLDAVPSDADLIFVYTPAWAAASSLTPAEEDHVLAVVAELRRRVQEKGRRGETRILGCGGVLAAAGHGTQGVLLGGMERDLEIFTRLAKS
jgi:triosephosphate isomerase